MKSLKYFAYSAVVALAMASCNLDTEVFDQKDGDAAYTTLKDIANGTNGAYYLLGHYGFLGNYAIALGDFTSGISVGSASSGHFIAFSQFTFNEVAEEFDYVWLRGYQVIDACTNTINGAKELIANGTITASNQPEAYGYLGQCYGLKALANYYLVNYFALPYSAANKTAPGIILIKDKPTEAFAAVTRATVEEVYQQILSDIQSAEDAFSQGDDPDSGYYMGLMAVEGLKARVLLAMGDYAGAKAAALEAIDLKGTGDANEADATPNNSKYVSMWASVAETEEDIFTVKKSEDDNLSANALNTLYGSYECAIQNWVDGLFSDDDIRYQMMYDGANLRKYNGKPSQAVTNIPVMRKSEMALIVAECEARLGNIAEAQDYLMYTAKRDAAITDASMLPSTADELIDFINDERVREFYGEGHRWFDARRQGLKVSGDNFSDWDIAKFVYPIPEAEINTGTGCTQNEGWFNNLPR